MNRNVRALAVAPALAAVIGLSACNNAPAQHLSTTQRAALAPYEAVVQKDVAKVGGPVALRHKGARHELYAELKSMVPQAKRHAFENAVIEDSLRGHLYTHAGRETFVNVTLPSLLQKYGAQLS